MWFVCFVVLIIQPRASLTTLLMTLVHLSHTSISSTPWSLPSIWYNLHSTALHSHMRQSCWLRSRTREDQPDPMPLVELRTCSQSVDVVSECLIVLCLCVKGPTVDGARIRDITTSSSDHLTVCAIVSHLNQVRHVGVVDVHEHLIGLKGNGAGVFEFVHVSTIHDLRCCACFVCHLVNWLRQPKRLCYIVTLVHDGSNTNYPSVRVTCDGNLLRFLIVTGNNLFFKYSACNIQCDFVFHKHSPSSVSIASAIAV